MEAKVIGIYEIDESNEPCFLVEMLVPAKKPLDFSQITQEEDNQPQENWQVPYDEQILDDAGEKILVSGFDCSDEQYWKNETNRIAFFFFYLDPDKELITPFGKLFLPKVSMLPKRLEIIKFEPPY